MNPTIQQSLAGKNAALFTCEGAKYPFTQAHILGVNDKAITLRVNKKGFKMVHLSPSRLSFDPIKNLVFIARATAAERKELHL